MPTSLVTGVVVLNLLALGLVVARGPVFGLGGWAVLLTLGLSAVPLVVLLVGLGGWAVLLTPGWPAVVWLLLLPNAGYLVVAGPVTDGLAELERARR